MFIKSVYNELFKKRWTVYTAVTAAAVVLALVQLGAIIYIDLFALKYHLDADASINFLRALEINDPLVQGAAVINTSGSGLTPFDLVASAALRLLGNDVFLYYGLSNIIVTILILLVVVQLLKQVKASAMVGMLCINILLCPYISTSMNIANDLGYYACMYVSSGYYGLRTAVELLIIYNVFLLESGKRNIALIIVSGVFVLAFGIGSGLYMLQTVLAPLLLYCIVSAFIKKDPKEFISKKMLYVAGSIALLFAAKLFTKLIYNAEAIDASISFISLPSLWSNICSVFYGFVSLLGALPTHDGTNVLSLNGVSYAAAFVVLTVFIIAFVYYIVKLCRGSENARRFLPFFCVSATVFIVQCLIASPFPNEIPIRGMRYLLPVMISGTFLICFFIGELKDEGLFRKCGVLLLAVCVAFTSCVSYKNYRERRTPYDICTALIDRINDHSAPVVYGWGESYVAGGLGTWSVTYNLRVFDHTRAYKALNSNYNTISNDGDYEYYNDNADWQGETLLISTSEDFSSLPGFISLRYEPVYTEESSGLTLYYCPENPFDLSSEVTHGKNTELPYSLGVEFSGVINEEGALQTDGTAGCVLSGQAVDNAGAPATAKGSYDITIHYETDSKNGTDAAVFSVMTDNWGNPVGAVNMDADKNAVTVKGVVLPRDNCALGYKVEAPENTQMRIYSVEINASDGK